MSTAKLVEEPLATVYSRIENYYSEKIAKYGTTPYGVDWSCIPTQELRFVQLLKLCDFSVPFSLNDVGCGFGALLGFLDKRHLRSKVDYLGVDLSSAMIDAAQRLWGADTQAKFIAGNASPRMAAYSVASGVFNVKLDQPAELWEHFVKATLDSMYASSKCGFAFNLMARLAPGVAARSELYRTTPDIWSEYCQRSYGAQTEVVSAYGLREFTILVRY